MSPRAQGGWLEGWTCLKLVGECLFELNDPMT